MKGCKAGYKDGHKYCVKHRCPCLEDACANYGELTNADRIRTMSDEELAKAVGHRSLCYYIQDETNFCNEREVCGDCIREWLKQPADMRGEEDG